MHSRSDFRSIGSQIHFILIGCSFSYKVYQCASLSCEVFKPAQFSIHFFNIKFSGILSLNSCKSGPIDKLSLRWPAGQFLFFAKVVNKLELELGSEQRGR